MLVCVLKNYDYPNYERQFPGNTTHWDGIDFVFHIVDECDYLVVLNKPEIDISIKCRDGGNWLMIQEPPYESNSHYQRYFKYFDKVFSQFESTDSNCIPSQSCLPWHVNKDFNQLANFPLTNSRKKHDLSWVTSNKKNHPGHLQRMNFLEDLQDSKLKFDLYGRGFNEINDKWDGLVAHKYSLAIENYSGTDYWTEKLSDAYLAYCMPIYYGCLNITDYFPENSMIKIDINKPQESIEIIRHAIANDLWEKNMDAIRVARDLVLNKYQLLPFICNHIKNDIEERKVTKQKRYIIPKTGRSKFGDMVNNVKYLINMM